MRAHTLLSTPLSTPLLMGLLVTAAVPAECSPIPTPTPTPTLAPTPSIPPQAVDGETCEMPLWIEGSGVFLGDTSSFGNTYSAPLTPEGGSCTGYGTKGPDVVYALNLEQGQHLFASLDWDGDASWDQSLWLSNDCEALASTCLIGEDNFNPEDWDYLVEEAGTYYIVVDGYSAASAGPYALTIEVY